MGIAPSKPANNNNNNNNSNNNNPVCDTLANKITLNSPNYSMRINPDGVINMAPQPNAYPCNPKNKDGPRCISLKNARDGMYSTYNVSLTPAHLVNGIIVNVENSPNNPVSLSCLRK